MHEPHFPKKKGGLDVSPNHPLRMVVCKYACKSHCQTVDQENRSQQFWLIALALEYDDIIQMQNYCRVHHRENNPYVSPAATPTYETIKL